jgi:hypothetical protein
MPAMNYASTQPASYWEKRFKLMEFLVQIHSNFQLPPEALFLSVNLLDRYCCDKAVSIDRYQLLGCTTLLIAAKYGDSKKRQIPSLEELCKACCLMYTPSMFVEMEQDVLLVLSWRIGHPDTYTFLRVTLADNLCSQQVGHVSMYITETALFFGKFACTKPSVLSKAAFALACCIAARMLATASSPTSDYDAGTFVGLLETLYRPPLVLVDKYASRDFSRVSDVVTSFIQLIQQPLQLESVQAEGLGKGLKTSAHTFTTGMVVHRSPSDRCARLHAKPVYLCNSRVTKRTSQEHPQQRQRSNERFWAANF